MEGCLHDVGGVTGRLQLRHRAAVTLQMDSGSDAATRLELDPVLLWTLVS